MKKKNNEFIIVKKNTIKMFSKSYLLRKCIWLFLHYNWLI